MTALMTFGRERVEVDHGQSIESAVLSMKRFPDAYIFLMNGKPLPMTSAICDGDSIEAVRIASGG